nr:BLUF domain-containing protein [uncultured Undibacterium sp.]
MMNLIQLVYVSRLAGDESVLQSIHSHAVRNNTAHIITGKLLYCSGRFLQVLEGEPAQVHRTFDLIKADPRHRDVTLLMEQTISERAYPRWNMGFRHVQQDDLDQYPAYKAYFQDDFAALKIQPLIALEIINNFV